MTDSGLMHCGWSIVKRKGTRPLWALYALWGVWHILRKAGGTQNGFQLELLMPPVSQRQTVAGFRNPRTTHSSRGQKSQVSALPRVQIIRGLWSPEPQTRLFSHQSYWSFHWIYGTHLISLKKRNSTPLLFNQFLQIVKAISTHHFRKVKQCTERTQPQCLHPQLLSQPAPWR